MIIQYQSRCIVDIDYCIPGPCVNGDCTDGLLTYTCTCDAGWTGTTCDIGKIHVNIINSHSLKSRSLHCCLYRYHSVSLKKRKLHCPVKYLERF